MKKLNERVFLDYASTTPVDKRVLKAMKPYFRVNFGNPSAFYKEGVEAENAVENAREKIATIAGVKPHEIIFTGSGTESDNLALFGIINGIQKDDNKIFDFWRDKKMHIITSEIEHPAVLESCKEMEKIGLVDVDYMPVSESGKINTSKIKKYLRPETILISVILANNEIGTIQSIRDISREIKKYKNEMGRRFDELPFLHTDASQAPMYLDIHLDRLGAHMITLDSSKIYGPKGVGCLIKKSYVPMKSITFGGGQEFGVRPGTENVPSIIGFARAFEIANEEREKNYEKVSELQKYFVRQLEEKIPEAKINGTLKSRIPNNINICIPGLNSEFAVIQLDEKGIACSAMTACKSTSEEAKSYVVNALGEDCGTSSLRFSFDKNTKKKEIDYVIEKISDII
jgi:cysteine desulfurase